MGDFAVPEPYVWDESFRVFYDNIDDEHKGLFKGIFDCGAAPADSAKLASLLQLVIDHFVDEESMMKKTNFDGLPTHNKIHTEFVDKLKSLSCPLDDATIAFAKKWLVNHIKGVDFKYKGKL
jgi:hemerythrin family non-heme iron protein